MSTQRVVDATIDITGTCTNPGCDQPITGIRFVKLIVRKTRVRTKPGLDLCWMSRACGHNAPIAITSYKVNDQSAAKVADVRTEMGWAPMPFTLLVATTTEETK